MVKEAATAQITFGVPRVGAVSVKDAATTAPTMLGAPRIGETTRLAADNGDVSAGTAVRTSVRAAIENPIPVALWGLIVAVGLLLGALPFLLGLAIVLPILGHATWHLYRKLVAPLPEAPPA